MKIVILLPLLLLTGCAGGFTSWYSNAQDSTFKIKISAGGLGQILDYEHTYKAIPNK